MEETKQYNRKYFLEQNTKYIKNIYIDKLNKILISLEDKYKKAEETKTEAINSCKILTVDFPEALISQEKEEYLNKLNNLDYILEILTKKYIEKIIETMLYSEIEIKLKKAIKNIENINLDHVIELYSEFDTDRIIEIGIECLNEEELKL